MTLMTPDSVQFHTNSYCDLDGRVFWWNGELYRGIRPRFVDLCHELFDSGIVERLTANGQLIESEITGWQLPRYPIVLRHRAIPFVSYASEWCAHMLRDAGLLLADILVDLDSSGLVIDVNTWDILFDHTQPVYVDFCSFTEAHTLSATHWREICDDIESFFVMPLKLMANGQGTLARWLLTEAEHTRVLAEFAQVLGRTIYRHQYSQRPTKRWRRVAERWQRKIRKRITPALPTSGAHYGHLLEKSLNAIKLPDAGTVAGPNSEIYSVVAERLLARLQPSTVLTAGCGWAALLAARHATHIVAVDRDETQVAALYQTAKAAELPILPLVMNVCAPTPGQGVANRTTLPALERLPCQMVIALGIMHALVRKQLYEWEQIAEAFAGLTRRWLLLDCTAEHLPALSSALLAWFDDVVVIEDGAQPVLLCTKGNGDE